MIRVMLVEDSVEYRQVIAVALSDEDNFEVSWQFGTAERAFGHLADSPVGEYPDVILLDLSLPGIDGVETLDKFLNIAKGLRVIILSQSNRHADVLRAISAGAAGYLLKSSTLSQIADGIRAVHAGGGTLDAGLAGLILGSMKDLLPQESGEPQLTTREMEVLNAISEGYERKEIAKNLFISSATVSSHISKIYEKLQVQNAASAVAKGFRLGLLPKNT